MEEQDQRCSDFHSGLPLTFDIFAHDTKDAFDSFLSEQSDPVALAPVRRDNEDAAFAKPSGSNIGPERLLSDCYVAVIAVEFGTPKRVQIIADGKCLGRHAEPLKAGGAGYDSEDLVVLVIRPWQTVVVRVQAKAETGKPLLAKIFSSWAMLCR